MNIVYAVPRYFPHLGGIENHVGALASRAAHAGHDVTVLTQDEGGQVPKYEILEGVKIQRFPAMLRMRGQGVSPYLWRSIRRLDQRVDILHVHNVHGASTLGMLLAGKEGRIVVTPHYLGTGEGRLNRILHRTYDPGLRRALSKAGAVICVSGAEARELVDNLGVVPERVRVIPNGVDLALLARSLPEEANGRVVFVASRLEPYKQVAVVVAAMVFLPMSFSLVIAGAGQGDKVLAHQIKDSGLSERVRLVGKLNSWEMARWYRRADVVVSMSRRECFGMTLAEGLGARCAVVASDIPAHREIVEHCGGRSSLVSVDARPDELAAAIARISEEDHQVSSVATWDDVAAATFDLYREMLIERRRAQARFVRSSSM